MANRTTRTPEKDAKFLEALSQGVSVTGACRIAGYCRRTVYDWREQNEEFAKAWDSAVDEGADVLEDEAWRRAAQGTKKPVFYRGEKCGEIREYSDTLLIFLLKGRRPEKYRENIKVDGEHKHSGKVKHEHDGSIDIKAEIAGWTEALAAGDGSEKPGGND